MNTTNPYDPPVSITADAKQNAEAGIQQGPRSFVRQLITAVPISLVVLASGPVIWLALLVLFGTLAGETLRVFHNQIIWEDEFVAKLPAALIISSVGAISALVGILTERTSNNIPNAE